jgi:hypothetical protein
MPVTAHPGHSKAFHYFDIDAVKAPVTSEYVVDLDFVREHIGPNTVALIGTRGTYPHGLIDPIEELGKAGDPPRHRPARRRLPRRFHPVVGGGAGLPRAAIRLPRAGRDDDVGRHAQVRLCVEGQFGAVVPPKALRRQQYLVVDGWPGGNYASPGMGGSRSAG